MPCLLQDRPILLVIVFELYSGMLTTFIFSIFYFLL